MDPLFPRHTDHHHSPFALPIIFINGGGALC